MKNKRKKTVYLAGMALGTVASLGLLGGQMVSAHDWAAEQAAPALASFSKLPADPSGQQPASAGLDTFGQTTAATVLAPAAREGNANLATETSNATGTAGSALVADFTSTVGTEGASLTTVSSSISLISSDQAVDTISSEATTTESSAIALTTSEDNLYPVGQCTWGVKALASWASNYWGNGGDWAANAAADGFTVGTTPVVGAIAVWTDGGYGHVAYVTDVVSETSIQVLEANVNGNQTIANHRGYFDPTTAQGTVSYIYPAS